MSSSEIPSTFDGPVRVRIAPSPTGDPHVGTAYAALFNSAFAERSGGRFVVRIEDTDRSRFSPGSEQQIFDTLRWLGFSWDEGPDVGGEYGPYRQSERLPIYAEVAERLLAGGHAYRCWCSPERLAELREAQTKAKQPPGYDRLCHGLTEDERRALPGYTPNPVVRMLVPDDIDLAFPDLVRGTLHCPMPDDQVLVKSDGFPTYHLAAVVDDHLMGISHIIRGEEWVSSTAKQLQLFRWLGWQLPLYAHFPLLRNADKSKISKRKNPAARLLWFQQEGFLPEALLNFLALLGYSMPDEEEMFDRKVFAEQFSFDRINPAGPVFDIDKLTWLNGRYIRALPDEEFLRRAADYLPAGVDPADLRWVTGALKERTKRLGELPAELLWLTEEASVGVAQLTAKGLPESDLAGALSGVRDLLAGLEVFEPEPIDAALQQFCAEREFNRRRFFMSLRVAIAGRPVSPPLHETIAALGSERTLARLDRALALFAD
ncbi:MAG TPA: glutamate--tRNA ligase [Jatrophihabitans sp.]|nr:glutamate--tRNA ligase [Jatrophihabitans sp.]